MQLAEKSEREKEMTKQRDLTVRLNLEQSELVLRALDALPGAEKTKVTYQKLHKDVELVKSLWVKRTRIEQANKELKVK